MKRVLIIEDDIELLRSLSELLSEQFQPLVASSAIEGLKSAFAEKPDLILVDVRMPGMDGFEFCRRIREKPGTRDIPVIMLTGDTRFESRVMGLDLGADDYVCKPFESRELLARIRARLRRAEAEKRKDGEFRLGNLVFDPKSSQVTVDGKLVQLTEAEKRLLLYFLERPNELLTRERILGDVWPDSVVSARTVDTHVAHLRKKLSGFTFELKTLYRAGYTLDASGADGAAGGDERGAV